MLILPCCSFWNIRTYVCKFTFDLLVLLQTAGSSVKRTTDILIKAAQDAVSSARAAQEAELQAQMRQQAENEAQQTFSSSSTRGYVSNVKQVTNAIPEYCTFERKSVRVKTRTCKFT